MARKIMIMRHAEKPDAQTAGISMEGDQDAEELTLGCVGIPASFASIRMWEYRESI